MSAEVDCPHVEPLGQPLREWPIGTGAEPGCMGDKQGRAISAEIMEFERDIVSRGNAHGAVLPVGMALRQPVMSDFRQRDTPIGPTVAPMAPVTTVPNGTELVGSTHFAVISSPVGELTLVGTGEVLAGCWFDGCKGTAARIAGLRRDDQVFAPVVEQLAAYFAGELRQFDLVLRAQGTPFQHEVWAQLRAIPYGETSSYGQVARRLGSANKSRAVGMANGRNPISIIVPCHRVIGADGSLTGFGGGMDRKRFLLDLESGTATPGEVAGRTVR